MSTGPAATAIASFTGLGCRWQDDLQRRASFRSVRRGNSAAVLRDDTFSDSKAEAGSPGIETRGYKSFKKIRQQVIRDTGSIIENRTGDAIPAISLKQLRLHADLPSG